MGVGGGEIKTIGYTCRRSALTVFGPGFNSRRLHHSTRGEWDVATRSPLSSFVPWGSHFHPRFALLRFGTLTGLPCVGGRVSFAAR